MEIFNLKRRVEQYKEVLNNTTNYREAWKSELKQFILDQLGYLVEATGLSANISVREDMENLEAIVLSLGDVKSGLSQSIGTSNIERPLVKHNGSLVYQQLFNGKVMVMLQAPMIEGYGEPQPPRQLAIYRPEEMTAPFFVRHLEELIKAVTAWEDYDDDNVPADEGQRIGFKLNFQK